MTLTHAAPNSCTNFSFVSLLCVDLSECPQHGLEPKTKIGLTAIGVPPVAASVVDKVVDRAVNGPESTTAKN